MVPPRRLQAVSPMTWWLIGGVALLAASVVGGGKANWSDVAIGVVVGAGAAYIALPPTLFVLMDRRREPRREAPARHIGERARGERTMSWDVRLNPVVDELAASLADEELIETLVDRAGLSKERIRRSRRSDIYWHEVLSSALDGGQDQVDAILDAALRESSRVGLLESIEHYRDKRRNASSPDG